MAAFTPSRVVSVGYGWNRTNAVLNGGGAVRMGDGAFGENSPQEPHLVCAF